MTINMWPWHEFDNRFSFIHFQHLSKIFCSKFSLSRKVHWTKTCAILFSFSPPPFLQKAFQETYSWWLFSREDLLGWTLNTRDQRFLGSLQEAEFASWLITRLKRLTVEAKLPWWFTKMFWWCQSSKSSFKIKESSIQDSTQRFKNQMKKSRSIKPSQSR